MKVGMWLRVDMINQAATEKHEQRPVQHARTYNKDAIGSGRLMNDSFHVTFGGTSVSKVG